MTRTAGAPIGCQRPSRFWGLGCPKIYHEAEDTLVFERPSKNSVFRRPFKSKMYLSEVLSPGQPYFRLQSSMF
ncbi:hypothetical protein [Thiolapillus sp.]|uniref:hypothetical protein n=1 Tax=Thiolapillus sp. TaxID=2017437 RepID=UPI003AF855C5